MAVGGVESRGGFGYMMVCALAFADAMFAGLTLAEKNLLKNEMVTDLGVCFWGKSCC